MSEIEFHDTSAMASDRVDLTLSREKLELLEGESELPFLNLPAIDEHLSFGDSRAALVVSREPFVVAAYTDELDCVALLEFPARVAEAHGLKPGDRLLTINTYFYADGQVPVRDLWIGPLGRKEYRNFTPYATVVLSELGNRDTVERILASVQVP